MCWSQARWVQKVRGQVWHSYIWTVIIKVMTFIKVGENSRENSNRVTLADNDHAYEWLLETRLADI